MKKRVLSLLMALAMCLSMLPATALAEELAAGTDGKQAEQPAPEEPEEPKQEEQPVEEQKQEESNEAVKTAQALIAALPTEVTAENAEEIAAQLAAIDEALETLTEEQLAQLDMTRYNALCAALTNQTTEQADGQDVHKDHPICGAEHKEFVSNDGNDKNDHKDPCNDVTWIELKQSNDGVLYIGGEKADRSNYTDNGGYSNYYKLPEGKYYLGEDIELEELIQIEGTVNLCLNGHSITKTSSDKDPGFEGTITILDGATFTLCDCKGGGQITHSANAIGRGVKGGKGTNKGGPTFNMFGGEISGNYAGSTNNGQDGAGVYMQGGYFNMYGGKITNNHVNVAQNYGGGGVYMYGGTFTMYDGEISNNTSLRYGGGIFSNSSGTINIYGGTISDNMAPNGNGGGVFYAGSSNTMTVSDKAKIEKNNAVDGGGIYVYSGSLELKGSISENTATGNGGGVYYATSSSFYSMTVFGSAKIEKNNAANGGGIYVNAGKVDLTGGEITGNTVTGNGGGVYYNGSAVVMTVKGNVKIIENTGAGSEANNVYVPTVAGFTPPTRPFRIGQGGLGDEAKIGVRVEDNLLQLGGCTLIAEFANNGCKEGNITSDQGAPYSIKVEASKWDGTSGGTVVNLYNGLHEHAICGKTAASCTDKHSDVQWQPLTYDKDTQTLYYGSTPVTKTDNTYSLPAGYYYLPGSIKIAGTIELKDNVNLCLNGKTLSTTKESSSTDIIAFITVGKNSTLTLCDCGSGGTIKTDKKLTLGVETTESSGSTPAGKFIMYGGKITGVVYGVRAKDEFVMYGGTITGTTYGVATYSNSNLKMLGGEITDCTGFGVSPIQGATMIVGGNMKITGNTKNVNLPDGATITIAPSLTQDAHIGITTKTAPVAGTSVKIATGATEELDYTKIFTPDEQGKGYTVTKDGNALYLNAHTHSWTYALESGKTDTITATCNVKDCPNKNGGSVTIKIPTDDLTYNGKGKAAMVTVSNNWQGSAGDKIKVIYEQTSPTQQVLENGAIPTNAGTYKASITMGEGDNKATASVTYTIKKATPKASDFTFTPPTDLIYDGTAKTATVTVKGGITGMGIPSLVSYYNKDGLVPSPKDAGTYTVKINVAEGTNYTEFTGLTDDSWTFTINASTAVPTVTLSGNMTYTGQQITPGVTVRVGNTTLVKGKDYTVSYDENKNVSTGGSVTITAQGNYGFKAVEKKFTIAQKEVTISGITAKDKIYDGTTAATLDCSNATITGKVDGDELTVTATGKFVSADANSSFTRSVTLSDLTLAGKDKDNYVISDEGSQVKTQAKILPATITVTPKENQSKTYNTADPELEYDVTGAVNNETPAFSGALARAEGKDVGRYAINIGSLKLADSSTFKASNYKLKFSDTKVEFTINKATYGDKTATGSAMYGNAGSVDLSNLIAPGGSMSISTESKDPDKVTSMVAVNNGTLSFSFVDNASNIGKTATIVVKVTGATNYKDYIITVTLTVDKKLVPKGEPTLSATEITYGEALNTITISGTMKDPITDAEVAGSFDWVDGTVEPDASDSYQAAWIFTPKETLKYATVTGTATITVKQAETTGEPGYSKITSRGKTLADVGLTMGNLQPNVGKLEWIDEEGKALPNDTAVEANKSYRWRFTPENRNYAELTGSITPWERITIVVPSYPTDSGNVSNPSTGAAPQGGIACGVAVLAAGICLLGAKRKNRE